MRAFGPFAGDQHIDFEPLGAGGLFLLDGPTGAGKSTVLDAITFALFGPGDGGGWGRLHSHFAAAGVEPAVSLEFSLRGVRQRVTRSPEYPRPKRRGEGSVLERAQVHLERFEDGRWVSRSSRKDEVGEMLCDDLGLTRDQFTQVVLLPQGEFMRFLRAGDDERRALLTKLFGTQLYDRITDELDRRRKEVSGDLDEAAARLRARVSAAGEAAGLDTEAQDELAALPPADRDVRLDTIGVELAAGASAATAAASGASDELAQARGRARTAGAAADRFRRFADTARRRAEHEASRALYEQAAGLLAAADRAEPVRPLLAALDDAHAAVDKVESVVPNVAQLVGIDWTAQAQRSSSAAAELNHLVAIEARLPQLKDAVSEARRELRRSDELAEQLAVRAAALPAELDAARAAEADTRMRAQTLEAAQARLAQLTAHAEAQTALAATEHVHDDARRRRDRAAEHYIEAADEHLRLADARIRNMAAELASALSAGEPCAVCGSVEHPRPAVPADDAVGAAAVAAALDERRAAEQERERCEAALTSIELQRAGLAERAGDRDQDELQHDTDAAHAEVAAVRAATARLPELERVKADLEVESARLANNRQVAVARAARATANLEAAQAELAETADRLEVGRGGHESVSARRTDLVAEAAAATGCATAVRDFEAARAAHVAARARAIAEAEATGFATLDDAASSVLPAARRQELRTLAHEWEAAGSALAATLASDEFAGLALAEADQVLAAAVEAERLAAVAEQRAQALAVEAERARSIAARFERVREAVADAAATHEALEHSAGPVVHLARLARGVAGQRRVNLTTYVLRQWFEQVVAAANVRLAGMSSGRYELVRVDEGASRTERAGLTLQVLDRHTGERRNARSLSGGETFYTSLALALGLADVVRAEAGGVDLDTLFIDEGFGSLDADTLDQVMAVIDELRDRGRTVGIVSHVHELKDRIAERIEVRRLPDGSSTLRVVA
jgi:exonuclease SbcC